MTSPIPSEPRTPALYHAAPGGAVAVWLAATGLVAMYGGQFALGVAGAPVAAVVGGGDAVAIGALAWSARRWPGSLGVRRAPVRFIAAGVLIGAASWFLRQRLVELFSPSEDSLKTLYEAAVQPSLVASLLAVALLPAITEELIFRGVIARAIARRSPWLAIAVSSILFAAYHIVPVQVLAVFPFGLAIGLVAVRADSVVPTIIAHAINNAIVIVTARPEFAAVAAPLWRHPQLALAGSSIAVAAGVALAWRPAA